MGFLYLDMVNWKRIKELQEVGIDAILKNAKLKGQYTTIYKKVFDSNLCVTCNAVIRHSFFQFKQLTQSKIKVMSKSKYKFKEGIQIWVEKDRCHYTNSNLTDKVAAALLKSNPAYAKFFAEMPEDGNGPSPEGKPLSKMNKTELTVVVGKLEGITTEEVTKVGKLKNKEIVAYIKKYKVPAASAAATDKSDSTGGEKDTDNSDGGGSKADDGGKSEGGKADDNGTAESDGDGHGDEPEKDSKDKPESKDK